jgi:PhzF family phenazine biosynthesis protein
MTTTPRLRPFQQVDVFTATAYRGNPLGLVLDGTDLDTATMQHFTNWTNLSECTFVLPPSPEGAAAGADYRVRIFCPGRELPFAGHPTLGTCHAWLRAGGVPRASSHIVQECGVGLVRIRLDRSATHERLAFAAPPLLKGGPLPEADVRLIAQGTALARAGRVHIDSDPDGTIWVGGGSVTCVQGQVLV